MKRSTTTLLIFLLLIRFGYSQTETFRPAITGEIKTDLINLLPSGTFSVDIMDSILQTPQQAASLSRMQAVMIENYAWFTEYISKVPEGEPLPYHKKFKMTRKEFQSMIHNMENAELVPSTSGEITIMKEGDLVRFKASGKLSKLNSVWIDLNNNKVTIDEQVVPYAGPINVLDETKGFKSKWQGYSFNLEEPHGLTPDDMKNVATLSVKQYKFIMGRLEKNGKTFLQVKGTEVQNGIKTVSFSLPIVF